MNNAQIADVFDQMGDLLEFQGANQFRVRREYRNAARTIRDLSESVVAVINSGIRHIDGVGKDLADKIKVLAETGELPQLKELQAQVPESVLAILRIPGVGPKKAALLFKELGVKTLDELKAACETHKVQELKGFGEKTEQMILQGMTIAAAANQRIYWSSADKVADSIREYMAPCKSIEKLEFGGSYRRGKETVGDLDLLVVSDDVAEVMDRFAHLPDIADVIGRGETKMSIRMTSGLQVDLRVVPAKSFGAALQYFTGSKDHNVVVRSRAKEMGLKVNEYGVFRADGKTETYVAGATEEDVYAALDLPVFPPELREARREFEWAEAGKLPKLIEASDILGDLHMHTTATDGSASIEEMIAAAKARGLQYIAITDHSQRVSMARGLDSKRVLAQWAEIDKIRKNLDDDFTLLKGIECDILEKGGMDLHDDVLAEADWVLASVHYGQKQTRDQITERILGALENPYVCAIAHPTGRLLNRREPYAVDMEAVYSAAQVHGKFLELNANPARLDLDDVMCATAKEHGIPIVINTDAHSTDGFDVLRYGILQARRAGLVKKDVANTRSWVDLKKLLKPSKKK